MAKRVNFKDLDRGDVFSINKEEDDRQYMKLGDFGATEKETGHDCIPALYDRVTYHYTVDVDNTIYKRGGV